MEHPERQLRDRAQLHPPVLPRWPGNAQYAPGFPIYPLVPVSVPTIHISIAPVSCAKLFVLKNAKRPDGPPPPLRHMSSPLRRKISIPKKQVHFKLPAPSSSEDRVAGKSKQVSVPDRERIKAKVKSSIKSKSFMQFHQDHTSHRKRTDPPAGPPQRHPSHHELRLKTVPPGPAPAPKDAQRTIWILTFAHSIANTPAAVHRVLCAELPPATAHLYTIRAYDFVPPPAHICDSYSGVSTIVQDYVMRDVRARKAVDEAIHNIVTYGRREMRKQTEVGRPAQRDVAISVCCLYGTHRSVSIAERIAKGLMGMKLGVKVVVKHVHRVRRAKDPY